MAVSGSYMLRQQNFYVDNKVGIGTTNPQLSNSGSVQIWYNVSSSLFSGHSGSLTYLSVAGDIISTEEVIAVTGSFTNITASTYYLDLPQGSTSTYVLTWNAGEVTYGDFENTALSTSIWKTNTGVWDEIWASNVNASVGIGTTSPTEKLEVYGQNQVIYINGRGGASNSASGSLILYGAMDSSGQDGPFNRIQFINYDIGGAPGVCYAEINAALPAGLGSGGGHAELRFLTGNSGLLQAMVIDENQNVGIGTADPVDSDLHVWGNVSASAYYGDGSNLSGISATSYWTASGGEIHRLSNVGIGTNNPANDLDVNGSGSIRGPVVIGRSTIYGGVPLAIHKDLASTGFTAIRFGDLDGNRHGLVQYFDQGSDNESYTSFSGKGNTSGQLVIKGGGEVGIGTTDPGYELHVHGAVSASSYSRTASIPIVWQGSVYDTITPPIRITDTFEHSKYMCSVVSGSCYVKIKVNDTTVLYTGLGVSASVAGGWQTGTPGGSVGPWVDGDYIRVEVSQSKACEGLSVSFYMTY